MLVFVEQITKAKYLNCGDLLRVLTTTYIWETKYNIQGNDLGHSNNVKNWTIRIVLLTN